MAYWPPSYEGSWTLAGSVSRKGVGLHTGEVAELILKPSIKPGFYLSLMDKKKPPIALSQNQVRNSPLCTTLEIDKYRLSTVEHLLAAIAGCGITHIEIELSGKEVPLLDGSAIGWVEAIQEVGIIPAETPSRKQLVLKSPLIFSRGNSVITAIPNETFNLIGVIDFPQKAIGRQMMNIELTPNSFVKEIAPARTFGFIEQIEKLRKDGLIKGGDLENALVCDGDKWLNPPLRFPDEPVRHKILDLIGDLALVGFPRAQILVYRGSHGLHSDLASALIKLYSSTN